MLKKWEPEIILVVLGILLGCVATSTNGLPVIFVGVVLFGGIVCVIAFSRWFYFVYPSRIDNLYKDTIICFGGSFVTLVLVSLVQFFRG